MKEKRLNEKAANALAKMAVKTLKVEANSASCILAYQPKAPKGLNQFKKK